MFNINKIDILAYATYITLQSNKNICQQSLII